MSMWLAVLCGLASACTPFVYQADFTRRSDSVRPGDLLGPFTGRVVDSGTGKPVPDALVYASWEMVRGVGFIAPGGAETWTGRTDKNGRYLVPALSRLPGGLTRAVAGFRLVVYKRGFMAYRSDRVFPGDLQRLDFNQNDNTASMERWSPELSHEEHLRFIGGSGSLRRETAWEVQAAVAQMEGRPQEVGTPTGEGDEADLLDASVLVDEMDLEEVTGYDGTFEVGRLTDITRSPRYDSIHFQAEGKSQRHDAAIRVWKLDPGLAEKHYARLLSAYPNIKPDDQVGDRSFHSENEEVLARVWLARDRGVVVSLTCGRDLCKDSATLGKLVELLHARLGRLDGDVLTEPTTPTAPLAPRVSPFQPVQPKVPVLQ